VPADGRAGAVEGTVAPETSASPAPEAPPRWIEPAPPQIVAATDLGSVLTLKHGTLFLLTDQFGDVRSDSRGLGLYHHDTRILSCATVRVNGLRLSLLQSEAGATYKGAIEMTNPGPQRDPLEKIEPQPEVELARRTLGIRRERLIAGALRERLRVVNHAEHPAAVELELELGDDAADIFEVRGYPRPVRGRLRPIAVDGEASRLAFRYDGVDGLRRTTHVALSAPARIEAVPDGEGGSIAGGQVVVRWAFELQPGAEEAVEWRVWDDSRLVPAGIDSLTVAPDPAAGDTLADLFPDPPTVRADEAAAAYHAWTRGTTTVESDHELFNLTMARSVADLRLLVNDGPEQGERYVAAGVPWFATLFGRDAIIVGLQSLAFRPQIAIEALGVLAARQATTVDDWRDEEPGKILHELRTGELARAGELPFTPYYGSIDATPLWLILLGATFDWTGDRALLDRFWSHALAALDWIDRYGDLDGDLFVEYARRSGRGLVNQGWKDSADAVRDRDGRLAEAPIALAEVQGYVYDAKRRMAYLATVRGEPELAARLEREAEALRVRFEEAFWVEDLGYYAMALDGAKRQADAIASNPGQCLWSGIVSTARAHRVADRLLDRGLFSGWGVRTYAARQRGYNPIGYHTGTVWPHDTSIIAAGLKRYGFHDEANLLIGRVLEAAQQFPAYRLPELFCGFERDETSVPVPYPVACSPQGWAAGAPLLFLQTMLGLEAHADRRELELRRPELPGWLRSVRVLNLRVGDAVVDLLFHTFRGTTSAEVLRKVGDLSVTIRL
jgi:glycogen debranching enzyme